MKKYPLILLSVIVLFVAWKARGVHKIIRIHDGDTITLEDKTTVRLSQIDAPEILQPFGDSARIFADSCLLGKDVRIVKHGKDIYKRTIADVYLADGTYFNELLVEKGYAWVTSYTTKKRLIKEMARAMKDSVGLWKYPHETPYQWRQDHKKH